MKKFLFLLLLPLLIFSQDTIVDPPYPPPPPPPPPLEIDSLETDSWVQFGVQYDFWAPFESNFTLVADENGDTIFYHQPTEIYEYLDTLIYINSGDYIVTLNDVFGDGWYSGEETWFKMSNCEGMIVNYDPLTEQFFTLDTLVNIWPCAPPESGCINDMAINYNENAVIDDGSCEYIEGCTDEYAENFDETAFIDNGSCTYTFGCTNEFASNYDSTATTLPSGPIIPGGSCNLEVWGANYFGVDPDWYFNGNQNTFAVGNKLYIGDNTFWVDVVSEYQGNCNAPAVLVYVVTTPEAADGSSGTFTPGTNVNAVVGDYWYMDPCTFIYGCTQPTALNFNPEAGVDDGSCINVPGCTDPTSINYNPAATLDDNSCGGGDIVCTENKTLVTVEIMVDQYAGEIGWEIYDNAENLLAEQPQGSYAGQPMGAIVEYQTCINDNTDIIFFLSDSYGDGLGGVQWGGIDGTWTVYTECGDTISQGQGDFGSLWIDVGTIIPCAPETVEGCTDDGYLEFDPFANTDDGSCLTEKIYDCINPDAFNYNEDATAQLENPDCINTLKLYDWADNGWSGSFMVVTQGNDWWGPFTLQNDQLTLEVPINLNTDETVKAYFYSFGQSQQTSEQCRFEIVNPIGDVILEGGTNPYTNPILSYNQYSFSYQGQALCGNNCIPKVYGCLDNTAVNYNELANTTDGSCYYNPGCDNEAYTEYYTYINEYGIEADFNDGSCNEFAVFGCMDEDAFNFNYNATVNGTAIGDLTDPCVPYILGCTDPTAFNYDDTANFDFDGLICEPFIYGCTDEEAFNYDPSANTNNDSCIEIVYGCTDDEAFNYDINANVDDETCIPVIEGCTQSNQFNYNAEANTDDGSCYPFVYGCLNPNSYTYNDYDNDGVGNPLTGINGVDVNTNNNLCEPFIYGCLDETAFNYNAEANTADENNPCEPFVYGCMDPTQFNYDVNVNTDDGSCIEFAYGCTDPEAFNYDETANTNVGCISFVYGCTDPDAFNYNPQANTEDNSCEAVVIGCTDNTANNYNENANTNSGCIYPVQGCTDPDAFNFNVNANVDDGTCEAVVIGCTDNTALNYNEIANTNSGCIYPILGCTDETAFNYNSNANTDDESCIPVIIGCTDNTALNYDETANTNSGCIPYIYGCTNPEAFNYDINANTNDESCVPVVIGCTDSTANNYDETANTNSGCIYPILGCTDPTAFNYDVNANVDDDSCQPVIIGCTDDTALNYNSLANTNSGCTYAIYGCTDPNAFNYDVNANVNNGSCIDVIIGCTDSTALNYNAAANTNNGCIYPVLGCTDEEAFNYNSNANTDDGSCIPLIYGCTDNTMFNYNSEANTENGSCIEFIYGCMDSTAFNYDPTANTDNNSCIPIIEGCTDPSAFNYNADANTEDFSCIEVVIGCTDPDAINYDPLANTDSGACIDVLTGCTDVNAYNYNLTANTDDGSCVYDAGCSGGPGEPYWLPNECFAWVISVDDECCNGQWDSYCVELYNYCDLGWPIDLAEFSSELLIYPNPVIDILNINQEINVKVYDMVGNLVIFKEKTKEIDMTNLPKGIYNLNINHNNKIINNRIVKQ